MLWRTGSWIHRHLVLQVLHNKPYVADGLDQTDHQVLQDLLDLLQEDTTYVTFLDLTVSKMNGGISTRLFRKPTATNSLLDYTSFHPSHTRNGVPVGQFLRVRRNCTSDDVFRKEALNLTKRFKKRNYPRGSISRAYQRANGCTQDSLLVPRERTRDSMPRFITQYNNQWSQVYIGQTSQELRRRVQKHFSTINLARIDHTKGKTLTSVAAHFLTYHAGKVAGTMVVGLERVVLSSRGGSPKKLLLQIESRWIFNLDSLSPRGLNEDLLFTGFLG
ncbi:uncharacterized protein [Dendrobates tinctorius]|uniref:uncharacterized protein n=1 Tax=Dendrobates tinctorius TaxID=92724 RepID=UPI003CCA1A41